MKKLRHRIEILQQSETVDENGYKVKTWSSLKKIWAAMQPVSNSEENDGSALRRTSRYTAEIWYCADLCHDHRIRYNGNDYDITEIINVDERNRRMMIHCESRS